MVKLSAKTTIKHLMVVLLAFAIAMGAAAAFSACDRHKRGAIIIVPDIFASAFYEPSSAEGIWDPIATDVDVVAAVRGEISIEQIIGNFDDEEKQSLIQIALESLAFREDSLAYRLSMKQDGTPYDDKIEPMPFYDNSLSYGVFGMYRQLAEGLKEEYGDKYEVRVFNWDWRQSPATEAVRLQEYINGSRFCGNILISHGQGSALVNQYLARNKNNRKNTAINIELAPTVFGNFDALAALVSPDLYLDRLLGDVDVSAYNINVFGKPLTNDDVKTMLLNFLKKEEGCNFVTSNKALICMLPAPQLLASGQYDGSTGGILVGNRALSSAEEIYAFYNTRPFAYRTEYDDNKGMYQKVLAEAGQPDDGDGYLIKQIVADLKNYYDGMFVNGMIASESVKSYYLFPNGSTTVTGISCEARVGEYDSYGNQIYDYSLSVNRGGGDGDGTSPFYSFFGGSGAQMNALRETGRVIRLNSNHIGLGIDWQLLKPRLMEILDGIK